MSMADKVDLKKELKAFYKPSAKKFSIIEVPPMQFLMVDGAGNPNTSQEYADAIATLFPVSYTVKFMMKQEYGSDYTVMPLEGLWWGTPKGQTHFTDADKDKFIWTSMIMQPDFVTPELMQEGIRRAAEKKPLPALDKLRFETFDEGLSVQVMYFGPYTDEGPTIERMDQYAYDEGYQMRGKHHEIYLSDFRRTAPEKLKTVLRHPIERK
jgi:hypothetical protein